MVGIILLVLVLSLLGYFVNCTPQECFDVTSNVSYINNWTIVTKNLTWLFSCIPSLLNTVRDCQTFLCTANFNLLRNSEATSPFSATCEVEICNATSDDVAFSCADNLLSKKFGKFRLCPNINFDGLNPLLFISIFFAQSAHKRAV